MMGLHGAASRVREGVRTGRRARVAGGLAGLAFAFVLLAPGTALAATAPQLGRCIKVAKHTGAFGNDKCGSAKAGNGEWEWTPGAVKTGFTIAASSVHFEDISEESIKCTGASGAGSYEGDDRVVDVSTTFTGCTGRSSKCSSAGAAAGEIVSAPLEGEFVFASRDQPTPLIHLFPASITGPLWSFKCGPDSIAIIGSVLGRPGDAKMSATAKWAIVAKRGLEPEFREYENAAGEEVRAVLEEELTEPGAETEVEDVALTLSKARLTSEEPLELNAAL
jgi:hypothetical protein